MVTHLAVPLSCLAEFSGMARPIIQRICKPAKNSLVKINVTQHHNYLEALWFFTCIFLDLAFRLRAGHRRMPSKLIKRRENNFPLTPIQMR